MLEISFHGSIIIFMWVIFVSACSTEEEGKLLKELFQSDNFKCVIVYDRETVEMCGALKVCSYNLLSTKGLDEHKFLSVKL